MADNEAKESDDKKARLQRYDDVVARAEIIDIHVVDFNFEVKPEFWGDTAPKLGYEVNTLGINHDAEIGAGVVGIAFVVQGKVGKKRVLNCKATYSVIYGGLKNCDGAEVQKFLSRVAPFACYPYFRSLFASMDWAAGIHLPPLPVYKEPPRQRPAEVSAD